MDFIPPELHNTNDNYADIGDPQMIWCSGEIASRASLPSFSDVGIFSLINLMTVEHVGSRPTPIKLLQMLRNKIYNINDVQKTLQHIYRELMGDIDELVKLRLKFLKHVLRLMTNFVMIFAFLQHALR